MSAKRRLDRQWPQKQRLALADQDRQLADGAHQQRPDPGGERQLEQMVNMLTQPVSAEHEASGSEGAIMQTIDRLGVAGSLGQNSERQIPHQFFPPGSWAR